VGFGEIYYYPNTDGGLQRITFDENFSDAHETFDERFGDSATNGDLEPARNDWGGRTRVRIIYERFTDLRLVAQLRSLESHLKRNKPIGIAADWNHAYASFANTYTVSPGGLGLQVTGNMFFTWRFVPYPVPGNWNRLCLRSQNPGYIEEKVLAGFNTATLDCLFTDPIIYNHENGPVFVRHSDFWPVLYLDPESFDKPLVTTDRWMNWTLDLNLVDAPGDYYSLYADTNGQGTIFSDSNPDYAYAGGGNSGLAGLNQGVFSGNNGGLTSFAGSSPLSASGYDTLQGLIEKGRKYHLIGSDSTVDLKGATSGPAFWK
jgi:hypothetical protein